MDVAQNGKKPYQPPAIKKLSIQEARSHILQHGHEILDLIFSHRQEHATNQELRDAEQQPSKDRAAPKRRVYVSPRAIKLTPEQARLKLLGYFSLGEPGAEDLLNLLFPDPGATSAYPRERQERASGPKIEEAAAKTLST
jgi:hypothetical protein